MQPPNHIEGSLVVTPFGPRPAGSVHLIPPGTGVTRQNGMLQRFDTATGALTHLAATAAPAAPPTTGFVVDASWANQTGTPISYFATSWEVPPPPATSNGQTIFLFNGMQDATNSHILQPVLQWGTSGAGGGEYWSIACWYAENGPSAHTSLIRVDPGTVLTGVMQMIPAHVLFGPGAIGFSYLCEFCGIGASALPVLSVPELTFALETLEVVNVTGCSDYPQTSHTPMSGIEIRLATSEADLTWTPANLVTDCGQHAVVVGNASPGGEVDLFYREAIIVPPPGFTRP
jgi:hypothetical protein